MITYQQALVAIETHVAPLRSRPGDLTSLSGAASATTVTSQFDVPAFDNAAMDGFALRAHDTLAAAAGQPVQLEVTGVAAAGSSPAEAPPGSAAVEIMTGAPLPADCDAVVAIERVDVDTDDDGRIRRIRLEEPVRPGRNVRRAGEDFVRTAEVVRNGLRIEPHHVMALAATGNDQPEVRRAPRVGVITTGSELADQGTPTRPGMIRDANGPYLDFFLRHVGAHVDRRLNVPDRIDQLIAALATASESADMILTTGGVSAGRFDLIPDAVKQLGGELMFHKVAIRPGKPLLFARLPNDTLLFGLPGNPIAAAVGLRFFVVPALRRLQGVEPELFHFAVSNDPIRKRSDLRFFGKASAKVDEEGRLHANLLPGQESFRIQPLARANCWIIVPEGTETIEPGERVQIAPLYPTGFLQP